MRTMYDSVTAADIPLGSELVAGYVDLWSPADWQRFPGRVLVRIARNADVNDGDVLDVEATDATPEQAPRWVTLRRFAGRNPSVYCSLSTLPAVRAACAAASVPEPLYWVANWTGAAHIEDGSVATQWGNPDVTGGHYDVSSVADYWPGIDAVAPPAPAPAPPPPAAGTYTVQPGDTLSAIAQRFYGDASKWGRIYVANRDAIGDNPDLIYAGTVLVIPSATVVPPPPAPPMAPPPASPPARTHTVVSGDTLSGIARAYYGNAADWPRIYDANRTTIGDNPDLIYPGQVLTIP